MKTDARVRYTKMRIREAFFQCLKEKPVSKITVREICDLAEINRATFYTHYADLFDLLEKLEGEAIDRLRQLIAECTQKGTGLLSAVLEGVKEPESGPALLASQNGDPGFGTKISELFYQEIFPSIAEKLTEATEDEREAMYHFLAGGCGNLITAWAESGMKLPIAEMTARIGKLTEALIEAYKRQ